MSKSRSSLQDIEPFAALLKTHYEDVTLKGKTLAPQTPSAVPPSTPEASFMHNDILFQHYE